MTKTTRVLPQFWPNFKCGIITIFKQDSSDLSDNWNMGLEVPKITCHGPDDYFGIEVPKGFTFAAPTGMKYGKCDYYWEFSFSLLGFGFYIMRQTGY